MGEVFFNTYTSCNEPRRTYIGYVSRVVARAISIVLWWCLDFGMYFVSSSGGANLECQLIITRVECVTEQ